MQFEYDPHKSASNQLKHGIDFIAAQQLWRGAPRRYVLGERGEMRYLVIGKINAQHWSAIITYRGASVRIISVRRSSPREIQQYERDAGAA